MHVSIGLTITFETPLSIGAGGSSGTLADKSIIRDGWNRPIIPGSQIKGKTRHMAEALARSLGLQVAETPQEKDEQCVIQAIFGASGRLRSRLFFHDLPLREPETEQTQPGKDDRYGLRQAVQRPSVSINRRRGVAEDQRLLVQETTIPDIQFHNPRAIVGTLEHDRELALVVAALRLISRWGGAKSRGLGWVKDVQMTMTPAFDDEQFAAALREWNTRGGA